MRARARVCVETNYLYIIVIPKKYQPVFFPSIPSAVLFMYAFCRHNEYIFFTRNPSP